ncbi:MAG: hypothetical protein S0880_27440 [Actinomycetota bacterium]|nr:hypothetical protein [Actinomycetota bacterium]
MDIGEAKQLAIRYETLAIGLRGLADDIASHQFEDTFGRVQYVVPKLREWVAELEAEGSTITSTAETLDGLEHPFEVSYELSVALPEMPESMHGKTIDELEYILEHGTDEEQAEARIALLLKASRDPELAKTLIEEWDGGIEGYQADLDMAIEADGRGEEGADEWLALLLAPIVAVSYALDEDPDSADDSKLLFEVFGLDETSYTDDPEEMVASDRLSWVVDKADWGERFLLDVASYGLQHLHGTATSVNHDYVHDAAAQLNQTQQGAIGLANVMLEQVDGAPPGVLKIDNLADSQVLVSWSVDELVAETFNQALAPQPGHPRQGMGLDPYAAPPDVDVFDASGDETSSEQQFLVRALEAHIVATGSDSIAGQETQVAFGAGIALHDPRMAFSGVADQHGVLVDDAGAQVDAFQVQAVVEVVGRGNAVAFHALNAGVEFANAREAYQVIAADVPSDRLSPGGAGVDAARRIAGVDLALDALHEPLESDVGLAAYGLAGWTFVEASTRVGGSLGAALGGAIGSATGGGAIVLAGLGKDAGGMLGGLAGNSVLDRAEDAGFGPGDPLPDLPWTGEYRAQQYQARGTPAVSNTRLNILNGLVASDYGLDLEDQGDNSVAAESLTGTGLLRAELVHGPPAAVGGDMDTIFDDVVIAAGDEGRVGSQEATNAKRLWTDFEEEYKGIEEEVERRRAAAEAAKRDPFVEIKVGPWEKSF